MPDDTVKMVVTHLGEDQADEAQKLATENAITEIHDIGKGKYDLTITVGPSFQSKRQEAVASQLDFVRSAPETLPIVGDLIVRNMDWPQADEFADRLKRGVPPQYLGDDDKAGAQAQQQAQMLMAQNQQLIATRQRHDAANQDEAGRESGEIQHCMVAGAHQDCRSAD